MYKCKDSTFGNGKPRQVHLHENFAEYLYNETGLKFPTLRSFGGAPSSDFLKICHLEKCPSIKLFSKPLSVSLSLISDVSPKILFGPVT